MPAAAVVITVPPQWRLTQFTMKVRPEEKG